MELIKLIQATQGGKSFFGKSRVQAGEGVDDEVPGAFIGKEGRQVTGSELL